MRREKSPPNTRGDFLKTFLNDPRNLFGRIAHYKTEVSHIQSLDLRTLTPNHRVRRNLISTRDNLVLFRNECHNIPIHLPSKIRTP